MDELQSQITLALLVPLVLQWLKGKQWFPLLGFNQGKLNALVAAVVALAGGLGIAFHFNYDAHELIITGLSWAGIQSGALHFAQQFLMQHAAYKTLIAPPQPGIVQAEKRDLATATTEEIPIK